MQIILEGGASWNSGLPDAIEAFFYDVDRRGERSWGGAPGKVRSLRNNFVEYWRLRAEDVPLLEFDRSNWQRPFTIAPAW